jgi:hypothetical protein
MDDLRCKMMFHELIRASLYYRYADITQTGRPFLIGGSIANAGLNKCMFRHEFARYGE